MLLNQNQWDECRRSLNGVSAAPAKENQKPPSNGCYSRHIKTGEFFRTKRFIIWSNCHKINFRPGQVSVLQMCPSINFSVTSPQSRLQVNLKQHADISRSKKLHLKPKPYAGLSSLYRILTLSWLIGCFLAWGQCVPTCFHEELNNTNYPQHINNSNFNFKKIFKLQ